MILAAGETTMRRSTAIVTLLVVPLLPLLGAMRSVAVPALFLAGDSTMASKLETKRPETGWGEALASCVDPAALRIDNRAKNGRSTRTFLSEGLWQKLIDGVKPGDYVAIQFGHNDEVPSKVDRYTEPDAYRANLVRFVEETRAKQATPLLLTPVERRKFDKRGAAAETHAQYAAIVRDVAASTGVTLIDMSHSSRDALASIGKDSSVAYYLHVPKGTNPNYPDGVEDNTHFSPRGAALMAELFVRGVRAQKLALAPLLAGCAR